MSRCGIVILAAGASTRMGVAKQSLQFEGSTLLARAVDTAISSVCRPIVVVLGSNAGEFQNQLREKPVEVVVNPDWSAGMGTSIRTGILAMKSRVVDAAMIFLCDQPLITSLMLDLIVATHYSHWPGTKSITAAHYAGTFGTPAIFASSLFDELLAVEDHQSGKAVINRHVDQVQPFPLPEAETDVDRPEDFARLVEWQKTPRP